MNSNKFDRLYDTAISNYSYDEILQIYGIDNVLEFINKDKHYKPLITSIFVKDMLENLEVEQYMDLNVDGFLFDYVGMIGEDVFLDLLNNHFMSQDLVKELLPTLILKGTICD